MLDVAKILRAAEILNAVPVPEGKRKLFFPTFEAYESFCRAAGTEPYAQTELVLTQKLPES